MKKALITTLLLAPLLSFAQTSGTATTTTATTSATSTQVSCIQTALEKRENALIAGHDVFAGAIKTALQNRLAALKTAWAQTDKKARQEKREAAWKGFRTEAQAANVAMKTVRLAAWKAFDTDMKACGVRGHGEAPQLVASPASSL